MSLTRFVLKLNYRDECVRVRPEPQYCTRFTHILEYIRETWPELSRADDFSVYYYDEAGDRCTLNERTLPDCLMLLGERNAYSDTEELPVLILDIERYRGRRPLPPPLCRPSHVMEEAPRCIEQRMGRPMRAHCEPVSKGGFEGMQVKPVVHHGFVCDGCEMDPLVGDRYKCNYCDDFDFCSKCFDKRLVLGHNPFHAFTRYKIPERPVFAATNSWSDKNTMTPTYSVEEKSVGDAPVTPPTKSVGTLPEPQATRDESVQWGEVKHCTLAGPWGSMDIFVDGPTREDGPVLATVGQPSIPSGAGARDSFAVDAGVHLGIECDCCEELPIVGPRYKCAVCRDYDLCEECFESTCPAKSHDHPRSSFYKLTPLETIEIRKQPGAWAAKCQQSVAPTVAVPSEGAETCGGPMIGPIAVVNPEPEPVGVVEASAAESEVDEEIEMERPPAESTNDGTGSDSGSWMDLGEVEEDIMSVGTPRSDQFQIIQAFDGDSLGDEVEVSEADAGGVTVDSLAEAMVHHGVAENRARAELVINQISSNEELRGKLSAFLREIQ